MQKKNGTVEWSEASTRRARQIAFLYLDFVVESSLDEFNDCFRGSSIVSLKVILKCQLSGDLSQPEPGIVSLQAVISLMLSITQF